MNHPRSRWTVVGSLRASSAWFGWWWTRCGTISPRFRRPRVPRGRDSPAPSLTRQVLEPSCRRARLWVLFCVRPCVRHPMLSLFRATYAAVVWCAHGSVPFFVIDGVVMPTAPKIVLSSSVFSRRRQRLQLAALLPETESLTASFGNRVSCARPSAFGPDGDLALFGVMSVRCRFA